MQDNRGNNAGWQRRVEEARRIRHTCVECGRVGLPSLGNKTPRCVDVPLCVDNYGDQVYAGCGGRGHIFKEVAKVTGYSLSSVAEYISDPGRERLRERRRRYRGVCVDCCGPTADRQTPKCGWCVNGDISPHRRETSPTGFRGFVRQPECNCGCGGMKAPGRHVCAAMAERLDRVRAEIDDGAADRLENSGMQGLDSPKFEDDVPYARFRPRTVKPKLPMAA